jgi:hypothetical protein
MEVIVMSKIIGNTTATPNPCPDWEQTDETKADYIKNKPNFVTNVGEWIQGSFLDNIGCLSATEEGVYEYFCYAFVEESLSLADSGILVYDKRNIVHDAFIENVDVISSRGERTTQIYNGGFNINYNFLPEKYNFTPHTVILKMRKIRDI